MDDQIQAGKADMAAYADEADEPFPGAMKELAKDIRSRPCLSLIDI